MNIAEIESELQDLVDHPIDGATFVFRFLEIYNAPKATVTKLKQGSGNHAKEAGDVLWKNKLFFRVAEKGCAASTVDSMLSDPLTKKHHPRFIFATDGDDVYCHDAKADQAIDVSFKKLNDQFLFFLPLANIERYEVPVENPADIKATGRIAKLYDAILESNRDWIERDYTHDLNQFMTRLLFCFFAEDTSIFEKDIFTSTVMNRTQEDGSDTAAVLDLIFEAMNTTLEKRAHLPDYARRFPYVKLRDSSRVRKHGDGKKGASADHLKGLLEVTPAAMQRVLISLRSLGEFPMRRRAPWRRSVHRRRISPNPATAEASAIRFESRRAISRGR
jgi:hypothetical protein